MKRHLNESAEKLSSEDKFCFYQVNDLKHSTMLVKEWILYNCPKVIKTATQSPNLTVIEHLLAELEIRKNEITCKNMKKYLLEKWNKTSQPFQIS